MQHEGRKPGIAELERLEGFEIPLLWQRGSVTEHVDIVVALRCCQGHKPWMSQPGCCATQGLVTDGSLKMLADDEWSVLDLAGCSLLSDGGVLEALAHTPRLRALDVSGCPALRGDPPAAAAALPAAASAPPRRASQLGLHTH